MSNVTEINTPTAFPWFAVRVRSRCEQVAAASLIYKGYAPFVPACTATHRWSDRLKKVDVPLFPGYVFCRFDPACRLPILTTPGVVRIAGFGKSPAPVDEHEMEAVRAVIASGVPARPWPFTREGDRIALTCGPLQGVEGIVEKTGCGRTLIVSITLLQRSVSVAIDESWAHRIA